MARNIADITYRTSGALSSVKPRPQSARRTVGLYKTYAADNKRDHPLLRGLMVLTRSPVCKHTSVKLLPRAAATILLSFLPGTKCALPGNLFLGLSTIIGDIIAISLFLSLYSFPLSLSFSFSHTFFFSNFHWLYIFLNFRISEFLLLFKSLKR